MKIDKGFNYKIFILIILIILLLASTYAWFTVNKNVSVNSLNVHVATAGNLEISADAVNWKKAISKVDLIDEVKINYPNAINQLPSEGLFPTSTAGNVSGGRLDMFFGKVLVNSETDLYELVASRETERHGETGRYIAFDIFLKVAQDATVSLNSTSIIQSERLKNGSGATGVENAVRMAVLTQGTAATSAEAQRLNKATTATIIEPNYDVHTSTGIENAQRVYNISGLKATGNEALQYYGIKEEIINARPLDDKSNAYFSIVNPDVKLSKAFFESAGERELFNIYKGINKIRIYIWVEGQDVDCEDYASGANLKFDLQFST